MVDSSIQDNVAQRIRARARAGKRVFVPRDFLDLGSRSAIDQALSRLAKAGTIRRLRRGVYDAPKVHPRLGPLSPNIHDVASAIARSSGHVIQTSGASAANALGLSTQVPAKNVYLTDGPSRTLKVGNRTLVFRHSNQLAGAGTKAGTVIQALRYLGRQSQLSPNAIQRIRDNLSPSDLKALDRHSGAVSQRVAREVQRVIGPRASAEAA